MSDTPAKQAGQEEQGYSNPPDVTPRREGGDDAIAERIISDGAADEKVLGNSQTAPPASRPLQMDEE